MRLSDASLAQARAADPGLSTWVTANAGSGKTKVLTDRVARLLLSGVAPQRILCLTYTKAAASEMQNRLFRTLGAWAMADEDALRAGLSALGIEGGHGAGRLADARRLFAQAIETPGGLRIQTIHSFCASILRRFPLEAGVSPGFTEMDDRAALMLRAEILDDLSERLAPAAMERLAAAYAGEDFAGLAAQVAGRRPDFAQPLDRAACLALFDVPPGESEATILATVLLGEEQALFAGVVPVLAAGSSNDIKAGEKISRLSWGTPRRVLDGLEDVLLTKVSKVEGKSFTAKIGEFPTKATRPKLGSMLEPLEALMARVEAARWRRVALAAAEKTAALHGFAAAFLPEYARRKAARGLMDFDDLILATRDLLTDPGVAQWVLYRLDGGIDHILVDEAQDTSPLQWQVVESLAGEFTAGEGARSGGRTLFVVGDPKQSIYSFQGADLATFGAKKAAFGTRLAATGQPMQEVSLAWSFRSSPAILRVVDAIFDPRRGTGLGEASVHLAHHAAMPGRVELWPPILKAADPSPGAWDDPVDLVTDDHHAARLGQKIAKRIADLIASGTQVPGKEGPRPMGPGDVLILVRRRSEIFSEVIRACKAKGLPVAGADRLKLGAEMAVKDLIALLSFLALPEDDLSLAAALRSPLFGWSEARLYALAQPRTGHLWAALRDDGAAETLAVLRDLLDQADFLRPHDLIDRLLTRHDGRRRLIARLGAEAEDGIDALLAQALAYERAAVPSLTGFLVWLQSDEVDIKRQLDDAGGRIRVMTVHGAKGLEAPLVILADTAAYTRPDRDDLLPMPEGPIAWKTGKTASPPQALAALQVRKARDEAESLRLLYVALTRAQSWLIIAAAGNPGKDETEDDAGPPPWYRLIEAGMTAAGAWNAESGGLIYAEGDWPAASAAQSVAAAVAEPLPDWAARPALPEPRPAQPLSPSDLGGAKALPGEGAETDQAMEEGTLLHRLLEVLPDLPAADRPAMAAAIVAGAPAGASLVAEALAVLGDPALAPLFGNGTMAEVALTARVGARVMAGTVDRLIVEPGRIVAVDYKSNRMIPQRPEDVPEGLLRQMGAYAEALAQIYPERNIEVAILWTKQPVLMPLPPDVVRAALARFSAGIVDDRTGQAPLIGRAM